MSRLIRWAALGALLALGAGLPLEAQGTRVSLDPDRVIWIGGGEFRRGSHPEDLRTALGRMAVDVSVGHLGYMKANHGIDHPGFRAFLDLLRDGRCWVKLSGSYRVTNAETPPYGDVEPMARALIEANEDRVLWGTDWPHPVFKGTMPNDGALMEQLSAWAPDEHLRRKILVDNPRSLYGF